MGIVERVTAGIGMVRVAQGRLGRAGMLGLRRGGLLLLAVALTAVLAGRATAATPAGLFLDQTNQVNSASLARDTAGGLHVAFAAYGPETDGQEPAHYAYCPSDCGSRTSWSVIAIGDGQSRVSEVQLALTPTGRPRMLILGTDASFMTQFRYAACESGCTNAGNWSVTTLVTIDYIDVTSFDYSQHAFALDHLGRPRFVYYDNRGTIHAGSFYAFCDTGCTSAANWSELLLTADLFDHPSLTFTTSGQPRLTTVVFGSTPASGNLIYLECNTDCQTNPASWQGPVLLPRGNGHSTWVLRLDSQNRPRIAFYQADVGSGQGNALGYLWSRGAGTWRAGT